MFNAEVCTCFILLVEFILIYYVINATFLCLLKGALGKIFQNEAAKQKMTEKRPIRTHASTPTWNMFKHLFYPDHVLLQTNGYTFNPHQFENHEIIRGRTVSDSHGSCD